jgi:hypothetical protein
MPTIPAFRRLRQQHCKFKGCLGNFEASWGFKMRSCLENKAKQSKANNSNDKTQEIQEGWGAVQW